jgi:N-methylhydantoinase A/oxoprolinase/acetone carboxylase beta subunit
VPALGWMIPWMISTVVVFPAPLGPRRPKHSPRSTTRSTCSSARTVAARRERPIYDAAADGFVAAAILDWASLAIGERVLGPAVLEHPTTTVYVAAGQRAAVDDHGNLIIERDGVPT